MEDNCGGKFAGFNVVHLEHPQLTSNFQTVLVKLYVARKRSITDKRSQKGEFIIMSQPLLPAKSVLGM